MPIQRTARRVSATRMATVAQRLLDASTLCAIATVARGGRAHVNTAYFAWTTELSVVWLSEPEALHSRNLRANRSVAIAVYDSRQSWGEPDRGIQLLGDARELRGSASRRAEDVYAERFPDYAAADLTTYRFYGFRPRRLKLFDEPALGAGVFVTARVAAGGALTWERTEVYNASG